MDATRGEIEVQSLLYGATLGSGALLGLYSLYVRFQNPELTETQVLLEMGPELVLPFFALFAVYMLVALSGYSTN